MAGSNNTTWSKGFSGNPAGEARGDLPLAELVGAIGGEWVAHPAGGEDALQMTRREALARTLWTRGVVDGDMTAIKLLVELLEGPGGADSGEVVLDADQLAAAENVLQAWEAEQRAAAQAIYRAWEAEKLAAQGPAANRPTAYWPAMEERGGDDGSGE